MRIRKREIEYKRRLLAHYFSRTKFEIEDREELIGLEYLFEIGKN